MSDSVDKLLADLDPLDEDQVERSFAALNANPFLWEVLKDAPQVERQPPTRARSRGRRWSVAAIGGIAVVLLALGALLGPLGGNDEDGNVVSLNAVAGVASASSSAPPARYDYLSQRSLAASATTLGEETWVVRTTTDQQTWTAEDGSGRVKQSLSRPVFLDAANRRAWQRAGSPNFLPGGFSAREVDETVGPGTLTDTPISAGLPLDPVELDRVLRERAATLDNDAPPEARVLLLISQLLASPSSQPELRGALYRVAAGLEGLRQFGPATDSEGREGQEAGIVTDFSGAMTRYSIVYDPETAQILSVRTTLLSTPPSFEARTPIVFESTDYLRSARTDTLGVPDGADG